MKFYRTSRPLCLLILVSFSSSFPFLFAQAPVDKTVSKEAMLRGIVRDVILPGYQDLNAKCRLMTNAFGEFNKHPDAASLQTARQAWIETLFAARRIQWVQSGPVADREYLSSFYYWRVIPGQVEATMETSKPVDNAYLRDIGPSARGLFALEYLLFDRKSYPPTDTKTTTSNVLATFSKPASEHRKQLLLLFAQDLESKSGQLVNDWSATGPDGAAGKFVSGGQQTVNVLVNDLARFVEQVEEQRVHLILLLPNPIARQMNRIENSPSDISQKSLVATIEGIEKLFHGKDAGSIQGYLAKINPSIVSLLQKRLDATLAAVRAINAPLEEQAQTDRKPLEAAYDRLHELELFCKVDLASTLGVTITFNSNDGD